MDRDNFFDKIIQETNKDRIEFKDKANKYLSKVGFFQFDLEQKSDFLKSIESLKVVRAMAKRNFSLVEMADTFDLTQKDFSDICNANPRIQDAIDLGLNSRNKEVEEALYKLATGYTVEEKTTYKTRTGNREMVKEQITEKFIAPNGRIATYLAENRRRYEFKSNTSDLSGQANNAFTIKVMFDDNE